MSIEYKLPFTASEIEEKLTKIDNLAEKSELPTKTSDLTNDSGYITSVPEDIIAEINALSSDIADIKAESLQQVPLFAGSIDGCTDTDKLYVLPDGFIYAYNTTTITHNPKNRIRESINSNGSQYVGENGEDGYKVKTRISSDGTETGSETYAVTGFIPCKVDAIIRTKNIEFDPNSTNSKIYLYNATFSSITYVAGGSATKHITSILNDENNIEGSIAQASAGSSPLTDTVAYIRISGLFNDTAIVTINEPLEPTTTTETGWHNTHHAFIPADYEDEIISLENRTTSLENRVDELSIGNNGVLTYVAEEAKRVAGIVQANRTVGSLTFTAMSDLHVEDRSISSDDVSYEQNRITNNLTSCRDAGLGLLELQKHLKLDFAAMLGDYSYTPLESTVEQVKKDLSYVKRSMTEGMKDIPNIWCTGNHDINYVSTGDRRMTEDELYAYLTSNNKGTIQDGEHIGRNYGYIDFENQKIRCIYLNTIDALDYPDNPYGTADDASEITAIQTQWLVDVGLNLTKKTEPTKWGIVLLSHHCLSIFPQVTTVLTAYKDGTSGSVDVETNKITTTVTYNFTSINRGEVICAIHGHNHNFNYRKISSEKWTEITEENAWLWSIGVPATETTRDNEVASNSDKTYAKFFGEFDSEGNAVYYEKTQGTATSTSFCVITIDRVNRKVHAIPYGAGSTDAEGKDTKREISY